MPHSTDAETSEKGKGWRDGGMEGWMDVWKTGMRDWRLCFRNHDLLTEWPRDEEVPGSDGIEAGAII